MAGLTDCFKHTMNDFDSGSSSDPMCKLPIQRATRHSIAEPTSPANIAELSDGQRKQQWLIPQIAQSNKLEHGKTHTYQDISTQLIALALPQR